MEQNFVGLGSGEGVDADKMRLGRSMSTWWSGGFGSFFRWTYRMGQGQLEMSVLH
jgi:hypothetical protein